MKRDGSESESKQETAAVKPSAPPYSAEADSKPSGGIVTRSVADADNGSMVQDFADLQRLGAEMERVKTGSELKEEGLVSDPIQEQS